MSNNPPGLEPRQDQGKQNVLDWQQLINRGKGNQDYVGDKLRRKSKNCARFIVININGLTGKNRMEKINKLKQKCLKYQADVICLTEMDQNLKRTPFQHRLKPSINGWWEHVKAHQVYNKHFDTGRKDQVGGTGIIIAESLSHRVTDISDDPSGLGRWTSMRIVGKNGFSTRIISAYRPCKSLGIETAYTQHLLLFQECRQDKDPREAFMHDLQVEIQNWREAGESIMLLGDFNTGDKKNAQEKKKFWKEWLETTDLVDVHQTHLHQDFLPATYARGTSQIDHIFISKGMSIHRAGFLPFNKFPGDHRALWVDVPLHCLIGFKPAQLHSHGARKLILKDPRVVARYISVLKKSVESADFPTTLKTLERIPQKEWTAEHTEIFNTIAGNLRQCMIKAESKCRTFYAGQHPWSPEFAEARNKKFFWELVVKQLLGVKIPMRKLLKLKKKLNISHSIVTLEEALFKQKQAGQYYQKLKKQTIKLRKGYLECLAQVRAMENNTKSASELKTLMNREETREAHRKIRAVRKKFAGVSTSCVSIPSPDGSSKLITEKQRLETCIMRENEKKYHQTDGKCPLMRGILYKHLGSTATTDKARQIVNGTYEVPDFLPETIKTFIRSCKSTTTGIYHTYDYFSKQHYYEAWRSAKERTGSGKVHFGHWKAGIEDDTLLHIQWLMTMLPGKHGFSPIVWQQATDVMILKKQGVLDIDKLRTIVLYEADFNFYNKCLGAQAIENAVSTRTIAEEQYARPGASPQDQCVNRRLIFDIVRYLRKAMAMASTDLKSCYDRIVHNVASLALQRVGISQNHIKTMFDTIQNCQHKVRTAFGDSDNTYGNRTSKYKSPIMGVGQGNGAGPQIWTLISSILFTAMHLEGFSSKFIAKLTDQFIEIIGYMYVDDMDIIRVNVDSEWQNLTEELQLTIKYWNKLVRITGGALEPKKSGWYSFRQVWNPQKGEYEYKDIGKQGDIIAHDTEGRTVELPYLSCAEHQEMLGVWMAPTGDQSRQIQKLQDHSDKEAALMMKANLPSHTASTALTSCILPGLTYCLPCVSVTQQEAKRLLRPLLKATLPKMGMVSTLGYDYIHGSVGTQGLGIPELYHVCYSKQIELLVDHLWKDTQTGILINIAIQEFLLEAGSIQPIFKPAPDTRIENWLLTKDTWIRSLRQYAIKENITISVPTNIPPPHRENDRLFMDALDYEPSLSPMELKYINICRIYKKVLFISDIATGDGRAITTSAWSHQHHMSFNHGLFQPQEMPSRVQWKAWTKGLKLLRNNETRQLRTPLGKWVMTDKDYLSNWEFFVDLEHKILWQSHPNGQHMKYDSINPNLRRHQFFSRQGEIWDAIPHTEGLLRATVTKLNDTWMLESYDTLLHSEIPATHLRNENLTLFQQIQRYQAQYSDAAWALHHLSFSSNAEELIEEFKNGNIIMVGDGSYDDVLGYGAGAVVVSTKEMTQFI